MSNSIGLWERIKRTVAHAFELKTKQEIREYYERLEFERKQAELKLLHQQHVRSLYIEHAEQIEQYHKNEELRRLEQEELDKQRALFDKQQRELEERVRLYRDNRPLQDKLVYGASPTSQEDTVETNTVEN